MDDELAEALKRAAFRSGASFKQVVNETLRAGLAVPEAPPRRKRYRVKTVHLGGPLPGIDLDRALRLSDALEHVNPLA